ncbi:MAG TPA: hypothetical protein VLE72_03100 [Candidatus Saccharimonadales bacterium]|nr:hypothetical protein [Candidatus Saccharimonadales bacterium]
MWQDRNRKPIWQMSPEERRAEAHRREEVRSSPATAHRFTSVVLSDIDAALSESKVVTALEF